MIFDEGSEGFLWNCPPDEECEWSCWCLWHRHRCGHTDVHSAKRLQSPIFLMNAGVFGSNTEWLFCYCSDHLSGLPHYDGWQRLKCHLTETERVEKVNSFHFHHRTADGILWSPTCSSTLAPFQNMLLINNISRNQYNHCLQIILNSTVVSTDRCVRSATNHRQPCTSVCWRPTPSYHVARVIIIKI